MKVRIIIKENFKKDITIKMVKEMVVTKNIGMMDHFQRVVITRMGNFMEKLRIMIPKMEYIGGLKNIKMVERFMIHVRVVNLN